MSVVTLEKQQSEPALSLRHIGLTLLGLMIFNAFALLLIYLMLGDGYWQLASMTGIITIFLNIVWLHPKGYPLRWMSPGISFLILISLYPILLTIYTAFTNFGTGHLLPKVQAIEVLESRTYQPEESIIFNYTVFQSETDESYALWLLAPDGSGSFATPNGIIAQGIGALDAEGIPEQVEGYIRLTTAQSLRAITRLADVTFGEADTAVQITARRGEAVKLEPRYVYNADTDMLFDQRDNVTYLADNELGAFVTDDGSELSPGYQVRVGTENFTRFLTNPSFRGPLFLIFLWTFAYALVTVLLAFSLGLAIAIFFGRDMPFSRVIKSLFIIPFAIPNVLTVLIWRSLLNPLNGAISTTLADIFNQPVGWPPVYSDPFWVKVAIIVINVWLAYPYFMLINSGALQAIPQSMYEAADIDGAGAWAKFRHLTLPMLLVGVGPLLIASFTSNFNAFNTIFLFNDGGPPMVGTATPAGHSDILISYVYRLAFGAGGGQDFGYASAITMIIFIVLLGFTLFQYRYMRIWEGVSENV